MRVCRSHPHRCFQCFHLHESVCAKGLVASRTKSVVVGVTNSFSPSLWNVPHRWQADLKNRELALECGINTQYLVARVQGDQRKEGGATCMWDYRCACDVFSASKRTIRGLGLSDSHSVQAYFSLDAFSSNTRSQDVSRELGRDPSEGACLACQDSNDSKTHLRAYLRASAVTLASPSATCARFSPPPFPPSTAPAESSSARGTVTNQPKISRRQNERWGDFTSWRSKTTPMPMTSLVFGC